jgi:hypothetical protein
MQCLGTVTSFLLENKSHSIEIEINVVIEDQTVYQQAQESQAEEVTHKLRVLGLQAAARTGSKKILNMFGHRGYVLEHIDDVLDVLTDLFHVSAIRGPFVCFTQHESDFAVYLNYHLFPQNNTCCRCRLSVGILRISAQHDFIDAACSARSRFEHTGYFPLSS